MQIEALVDRVTRSGPANASDELRQLETVQPRRQEEWERIVSIFAALGRPHWEEVMKTRFLEIEPVNRKARLRLASLLSLNLQDGGLGRERRSNALTILTGLRREALAASEIVTVGQCFFNCGQSDDALNCFEQAIGLDPSNIAVRISVVHSHVNRGARTEAAAALKELRSLVRNNPADLLSVASLAIRLDNKRLARRTAKIAFQYLGCDEINARIGSIDLVPKLGLEAEAIGAAKSLQLGSLSDLEQLRSLLAAVCGWRNIDLEQAIINRALDLEPTNRHFQQLKNQSKRFLA